jgi:hypothetical protein
MAVGEGVAEALELLGIRAGKEAVVEGLIGDALFLQAALGPLMAIEANLDPEGGVGADLDEGRAEVPVDQVEVVGLEFSRVVECARSLSWTRDPFDRLIVGQAIAHGKPLITKDAPIPANDPRAVW